MERLLEHCSPLQGKSVLEMGGAFGATQWWVAARGARVVNVSRGAFDASPPLRKHVKKPLPIVEYCPGDFFYIRRPGEFDAALAISSLEHNHPANQSVIMANIAISLVPGGIFIVTIPVGEKAAWHPCRSWAELPEAGDTLLFDPDAARNVLVRPAAEDGLICLTEIPPMKRWPAMIKEARKKIAATEGARSLPYLSGGLVFRKEITR